jgi:hypothetical protein
MAKTVTANQQTALSAPTVRPVLFLEMDFASGVARYVTAGASIAWNTYDWLAVGNLIDIGPIEETSELSASGIKLTISGVPSSLISLALGEAIQGRRITIWFGLIDSAGALIDTPVKEWEGRMDVMSVKDTAGAATIEMTCESRMAALLGSVTRRYTDEDQQAHFPGDDIFKFVPQMTEKVLGWNPRRD